MSCTGCSEHKDTCPKYIAAHAAAEAYDKEDAAYSAEIAFDTCLLGDDGAELRALSPATWGRLRKATQNSLTSAYLVGYFDGANDDADLFRSALTCSRCLSTGRIQEDPSDPWEACPVCKEARLKARLPR